MMRVMMMKGAWGGCDLPRVRRCASTDWENSSWTDGDLRLVRISTVLSARAWASTAESLAAWRAVDSLSLTDKTLMPSINPVGKIIKYKSTMRRTPISHIGLHFQLTPTTKMLAIKTNKSLVGNGSFLCAPNCIYQIGSCDLSCESQCRWFWTEQHGQ